MKMAKHHLIIGHIDSTIMLNMSILFALDVRSLSETVSTGNHLSKILFSQGEVMRDAYHQFMKEQMNQLRLDNPTKTGREILQMARDSPDPQ